MKLYGKGGITANRHVGAYLAIMCGAKYLGIVGSIHVVAVYEVEVLVIIDTGPQRVIMVLLNQIPAHVGYFQALLVFVAHVGGELINAAFEKAQTINAAVLFTALQEHLLAYTNSQ